MKFFNMLENNRLSKIHNHSENGCIFKVLDGQLSEFIYSNKNINLLESNNLIRNSVSYIDDSIGFHKVGNDSKTPCSSIHIYSPPKSTILYFK